MTFDRFEEYIWEIQSLLFSMKHYPGLHNQASHGNRYGSASSSYASLSTSKKSALMQKTYENWIQNLTSEERSGITTYTGGAFFQINALLRSPESEATMSEATKHYYQTAIDHAISGLEKGNLPFAITVNRSMGFSESGADAYISEMKANVGKTFTDAAFISTSITNAVSGNISFTIHVPEGAKGLYVEPITKNKDEYEYLIPRNPTFIVYKVEKDAAKEKWEVELGYLK